jgi:hypothetical protein
MKTMLLFLLLGITYGLNAQEPLVEWGNSQIDENVPAKIQKIMTINANGLYVLRKTGNLANEHYWIEKYDNSYKKMFSKEFPTAEGVMGKSLFFRIILATKDKFLLFYDGWNKDQKNAYCLLRKVNLDGDVEKDEKEIESIVSEKQLNSGNFYPVLSPDKSKLLILTNMPFVKDEKEKIRLSVFDVQTFNKIWSKDITLNNESRRDADNEGLVDNNGNVFMLKKITGEKQKVDYLLYSYNATSQKWTENPLNMDGKMLVSKKFFINNKGDNIITGFYSTKNERLEGTYYFRFSNTDQSLVASKIEPFGSKLLENFMNEKNAAEDGAYILNFKIKDVLSQSNGNSLIISENQTERSTPSTDPAKPGYIYNYDSNDIMVICLQNDGSKLWSTVLKKNQSEKTTDPNIRWDSFVYGLVGDKLYVLWNNISLTPPSIPAQYWKEADGTKYVKREVFAEKTVHATFMYEVKANGESTYANRKYGLPLFNMHKGSAYYMSMNPLIFQAVNDGIILMGESHDEVKMYKFGEIKLQ